MLETYDKGKIAGCFGFGCLLVVVLFALGGLGAYFGVKTFVESAVDKYTERSPAPLAQVNLSVEESLEITEKIDSFKESFRDSSEDNLGAELELTSREVNYLISNSLDPLFVELRDKVRFKFEEGKIKTDLSLPLDKSRIKNLQGRYLNGTADMSLGLEGGELDLNVSSLRANGFDVPDNFLNLVQERSGIMERVMSDARFAELSQYLESFEVVGDRVKLKLKKGVELEEVRRKFGR